MTNHEHDSSSNSGASLDAGLERILALQDGDPATLSVAYHLGVLSRVSTSTQYFLQDNSAFNRVFEDETDVTTTDFATNQLEASILTAKNSGLSDKDIRTVSKARLIEHIGQDSQSMLLPDWLVRSAQMTIEDNRL